VESKKTHTNKVWGEEVEANHYKAKFAAERKPKRGRSNVVAEDEHCCGERCFPFLPVTSRLKKRSRKRNDLQR